jgi:hypothetical protein
MSDRETDKATGSGSTAANAALSDALRNLGYDIEPPSPGNPPSSEIVARRDLGDRVILFIADGSGRFRIEITWLVGEWPSRTEIAGVPLRAVDRVSRSVNLVGQTDEPRHLADVAAGLGAIVPWAGEVTNGDTAAKQPPPPP